MEVALIILSLLLALQTVRVWINKRLCRAALKRCRKLKVVNAELRYENEALRCITQAQGKELHDGDWPELFEEKRA